MLQSALKVRLVRAFAVPVPGNIRETKTYECVFHDSEGDRIHGTIQNTLIPTFKPLLEEGCLYGIKNFIVTQNANKYKTTENKYRIIFLKRTWVYVVGVVKEMGQPENRVSSNGKQSKLVELMLEDIEGNRLPCTLWEEYVDQFLKYCGKTCGAPKIMILQMVKLNMYRGKIKVVNTCYVTKVVMDSEVPEIRSFKERLGAGCSLLDTIVIGSISNGSSSTISNEMCAGQNVLKTIAQLFDGTENGSFWLCGTIVAVDGDGGWYYISFDETGSALFLLWDMECLQLIGRSAGELNTKNVVGEEEVDILSEIEEALVDKKMIFKVNVRGEECIGAYTIAKIITDPIIVNTYFGHLLDSQESNCISNLETSNVNDEKVELKLFLDSLDTPIEPPSSSRDEDKNLVGETPCSSSKEIGSVRRCLANSFSSTDASKKTKVFIKKEKE
ncbi:hypothetical protein C2S53_015075 [Perilla frutescens var. hirtella]|uniref:Replication protein A 70 kDa DNA-binding subunit B/D first OB fold domain-containing protein n=1 Tax=Perilla frutescens var. hirtella TaxID=608512 RepID=A0AAD4P948_PERFH|nr:hypothetical protein C2S53_015075 [Perilla frutescens var. hirtella]